MKNLNTKKQLGFVLLAIVVMCWIAVPILPFFEFQYKAIVITAILIIGEILFVVTIALLGKEYWSKIKKGFIQVFSYKKKDKPINRPEDCPDIKIPTDESEIL